VAVAQLNEERDTFRAQARYVRTSAQKARLVLEHIRGKGAEEASAILRFSTRAAAKDAYKVLHSAVANAESNHGHDADELVVVAAYADEGPTLKRWRPRARGRVNRIQKRTCHITILLAVAREGEIKRRERRRPQAAAQAGASTRPVAAAATAVPAAAEPAATPAEEAPEAPEAAAEPVAADEVAAELEGEEVEETPAASEEASAAEEAPPEDVEADAGETEPAAEATPGPEDQPAAEADGDEDDKESSQ
jgi:large subunit ribosomal protein L22